MPGTLLRSLLRISALLVTVAVLLPAQARKSQLYCSLTKRYVSELCASVGTFDTDRKIALLKQHGIGFDADPAFLEDLKNTCGDETQFLDALKTMRRATRPVTANCTEPQDIPPPPMAAEIINFSIDRPTIIEGETAVLKWQIENFKSAKLDGQPVEATGEKKLEMAEGSEEFTLVAVGPDNKPVSRAVQLVVKPMPLPQGGPLTLHQVLLLLEAGADPKKVDRLVKARKVNFVGDAEAVQRLQSLGAKEEFILMLLANARK
jgi:hypothetical protein